jgi:hypothetical protein
MKIFKNPLFWIGAVAGGAWLIKNKPTSKGAQVASELQEGAESLAESGIDFATEVVDTAVGTAQDVWGVFEASDADGDIDSNGIDGADSSLDIDNEETPAEDDGDSNAGGGVDVSDEPTAEDNPDDEGVDGQGFNGEAGRMNFNDYDY